VGRSAIRTVTLAMFATLSISGAALSDDLVGQASVIDGDTLEIHGTRIRLWDIDAPESTQLCRGDDSKPDRCGVQYSMGRYNGDQRAAETAGAGIWKGSYVEPWLYRACIRASGTPSGCSDDATAYQ
jgi:endonuclease YncB( thermonuclease family)